MRTLPDDVQIGRHPLNRSTKFSPIGLACILRSSLVRCRFDLTFITTERQTLLNQMTAKEERIKKMVIVETKCHSPVVKRYFDVRGSIV